MPDEHGSITRGRAAAGYVVAVVLPIVGFVIGVILVNRPEKASIKQGLWMIALSVVAAFVLFVVLIVSTHSALLEGNG
jgi:uncharacterized membrane protein YeaQ/YmgE (transglycosylase-associated protein family)